MKAVKRIILITLLLSLLAGALCMDPLVSFTINLYLERFEAAEAVYLSRIQPSASDRLHEEADKQLRRYAQRQVNGYETQRITYDQAMAVLSSLTKTRLPQEDVGRCFRAISKAETTRIILIQANEHYAAGEYAEAIPLYRQAQGTDEAAAFWLRQAEASYKNHALEAVEAAMDAGQYDAAQSAIQEGLRVLGADDDLSAALTDVRRMKADEAYGALTKDAEERLRTEGPEAAFRFVADLREQVPEDYGLEYLEQLIRYEYEDDICARARSAWEGGDPAAACALLEEGLLWIDSQPMKTLRAQIQATLSFWLVDMPLLKEETGRDNAEAKNTVTRDQVLTDNRSNTYSHSFSVDHGSVSFDLQGDFAVFSGTVAFPQGERSDIYRESATLRMYADGKLLSEFKNIDSATAPLPFSLPVAGVKELTLTWTCEGANGWKDWGSFATIFDGKLMTPDPAQ